MKNPALRLLAVSSLLALAACETTSSSSSSTAAATPKSPPVTSTTTSDSFPEKSPEGLTRVHDTKADLVYVLPNVDLSPYTKVALTEPEIAFRQNWLGDTNASRAMMDRLSASEVAKMVAKGKELLRAEFVTELEKAGYTVVTEAGPDVLVVKTAVLDVDIFNPDPNNLSGVWKKSYSSNGVGEATMCVELLDSVTGTLYAQAFDHKSGREGFGMPGMSSGQGNNIAMVSNVMNYWANALVKGMLRVKAAHVAAPAPKA